MLTDAMVRGAKPQEKTARLYDERGLYLEISPAGGRWWRWKYRAGGKEKRLSLGVYPDVSLREARLKRDEARKVLAAGSDPGEERKQAKRAAAATFEVVAREWIEIRRSGWAASHAERTESRLRRFLFPWLGAQAIEGVTAEVLLGVLRRVEERSAGEAQRVRVILGQVLDFAVQTGRAAGNPARSLRGALKPAPSGHFAAPTTPEALRGVLLA
ncbi:MAG: tyrosine-type recombinase/integrase, partial [Betaproteobacteria bacterium]